MKTCEHCDGTGEVEMDNNGPISTCPVCQPGQELGWREAMQAYLNGDCISDCQGDQHWTRNGRILRLRKGKTQIDEGIFPAFSCTPFLKSSVLLDAQVLLKLEKYKEALKQARHALTMIQGCRATDRPDLCKLPEELFWTINNSKEIEAIDAALAEIGEEKL